MKKRFTLGLLSFGTILGTAAIALAAPLDIGGVGGTGGISGAGTGPAQAGNFSDLGTTIQTIFNFVILLSGVIFIVLFLVGGVTYLTAAGNEEQTGKARKLLVDAVVGMVIVLASWALGSFVLKKLGVTVQVGDTALNGITR